MRRSISLLAFLGACSQQQPAYTPPPVPTLTARGLPFGYETCVQNRSQQTADMYGTFLSCRIEIALYLAKLPISQEEKADRISELERRAMNYAQEQAEARHGAAAVAKAMHQQPPPTPTVPSPAQLPSPAWNACAGAEMHTLDIMSGPVGAIGEVVAARCRSLYSGPSGGDIDIVVRAVEKLRTRSAESVPAVIDQKPMGRGDLRF